MNLRQGNLSAGPSPGPARLVVSISGCAINAVRLLGEANLFIELIILSITKFYLLTLLQLFICSPACETKRRLNRRLALPRPWRITSNASLNSSIPRDTPG